MNSLRYESLIRDTFSQMLDLNQDDGQWYALYTKLAGLIWSYTKEYRFTARSGKYSSDMLAECGIEVMECVKRCVKSFNQDKGCDFVAYVMSAITKEVQYAALHRYKNESKDGKNSADDAEELDNTPDVRLILAEEEVCNEDSIKSILSAAERVYRLQQERTKPLAAALLTRQAAAELFCLPNMTKEKVSSLLCSRVFCDKQVLQECLVSGIPAQEAVCRAFGKDKTEGSRLMNRLVKRIAAEMST